MQPFPDMAQAHEWTLRRLREMAGRLTEQAYLRASAAAGGDDEAQARWMLVFDRMARGLRLSIALEARLARERRAEAPAMERGGADASHADRPAASPTFAGSADRERDEERDDDGGLPETAPLAQRIGQIQAILEGADAPEPMPRPVGAERHALGLVRAERARRAARDLPPDEPWDVLTRADLADHAGPPWPGAG